MSIGEQIRRYRREQDLTQAELADRVGINKQNISRYESGRVEPRKTTLRKLAEVFGISIDELMGTIAPANDDAVPQDPKLLKLIGEVEKLPEKDKEALIRLITIVIREHRIQSAIAS